MMPSPRGEKREFILGDDPPHVAALVRAWLRPPPYGGGYYPGETSPTLLRGIGPKRSKRISKRELRPEFVNRMIGEFGFGKPGVGDMLVLDTQANVKVVAEEILGSGSSFEGEVEVLTQAALGGIGIGEAETDAAFHVGNDLPARLHEIVAGSNHDAFEVIFRSMNDLLVVPAEEKFRVAAQIAAEEMIEAHVIQLEAGREADRNNRIGGVGFSTADIRPGNSGAELDRPVLFAATAARRGSDLLHIRSGHSSRN